MKNDKYKITLKLYNDGVEGKEEIIYCKTREEVAELLDIKVSTVYALQRNTILLKHKTHEGLKNIKLEKIHNVPHSHNKKKQPLDATNPDDYAFKLLEKMKSVKI